MEKKTIIGFLTGTAIGAALGLAFAPKSGKEIWHRESGTFHGNCSS